MVSSLTIITASDGSPGGIAAPPSAACSPLRLAPMSARSCGLPPERSVPGAPPCGLTEEERAAEGAFRPGAHVVIGTGGRLNGHSEAALVVEVNLGDGVPAVVVDLHLDRHVPVLDLGQPLVVVGVERRDGQPVLAPDPLVVIQVVLVEDRLRGVAFGGGHALVELDLLELRIFGQNV